MKVLHVIPSINPLRGGPSQAIIEMVRALRTEGIDACIVTTQDNGIYRNKDIPLNQWIMYEGVPTLVHSCLDSRIRGVREFLFSLSFGYWLIKNVSTYDMVHIHAIFSFPSTISMLFSRIKGVPYIVRTIGQLNSWSLNQSALRKIIMMALVERKNLYHAKAIHVTSKYELQDLESLGLGRNCFILGLGVDMPNVCNSKEDGVSDNRAKRVRLLFLSRIHPKKQLELLLSALAILKHDIKEERWELAIAGSGEPSYIEMLKGKSTDLGIEEHIIWHGHVAGEAKRELFHSSDWFVLPSASENFGISVVEAMASALPVVITENTGISEKVIEYSAGYICSEKPWDFAQVLSTAINNPESKSMGKHATVLVAENFSWTLIAKTLSDLYYILR